MWAKIFQWHIEIGDERPMGDTVKVSEKQGCTMPRVDEIESTAEAELAAQSLKLLGLFY